MSDARWCDYADHPFKGGQQGTIVMGQIDKNRSVNEYITNAQLNAKEICPECAASLGLYDEYEAPLPPATRHAKILGEAVTNGTIATTR